MGNDTVEIPSKEIECLCVTFKKGEHNDAFQLLFDEIDRKELVLVELLGEIENFVIYKQYSIERCDFIYRVQAWCAPEKYF